MSVCDFDNPVFYGNLRRKVSEGGYFVGSLEVNYVNAMI